MEASFEEINISTVAVPIASIGYAPIELNHRSRHQTLFGILSIGVAIGSVLISLFVGTLQVGQIMTSHRYLVRPSVSASMAGRNFATAAAGTGRVAHPPLRPMNPEEFAGFVAIAQSRSGHPFNPAQTATLGKEMGRPGQVIVDPTLPLQQGSAQLPGVSQQLDCHLANGNLTLYFRRNYSPADMEGCTVLLDASGQLVSMNSYSPAGNSLFLNGGAASMSALAARIRIREISASAAAIATALNFGLAIFLLVAGIAALGRSQRWLVWHRFYAWCKLILAPISALLFAWMMGGFASVRLISALTIIPATFGALACIYPIVLLTTTRPSDRYRPANYAATGTGT